MSDRLELRPATAADIPAMVAIHDANDDPPAGAPPMKPGARDGYFRHLLVRARVIVAAGGDDAGIVGFGAVVDTGRAFHLADLFTVPARAGTGIGGRLLDALFEDRRPRTTFASDDPRAIRLYVRAGMLPYWPNFYLVGDGRRLPEPEGIEVAPASADEVARIEAGWTGIDRAADHALWASRPGNAAIIVRIAGRGAVAVGHSRPRMRGAGRWLERLTIAPDVEPRGPIVAAFVASADEDGHVGGCLLGANPAVPVLLDAGFRIADRDTAMASDPSLINVAGVVDTGIP